MRLGRDVEPGGVEGARRPAASPIGDSTACRRARQRSATQRSTRRFSPKPGHRNFPLASWRNQLTWKMRGGCFSVGPTPQPVRPVVGHVVAAEGQHRHGIAPHHADGAALRRGGFGRHDGADEDAVRPVARLEHQRRHPRPAAAEQERADRHALRVFPVRRDRRALPRRRGEARVRDAPPSPCCRASTAVPASRSALGHLAVDALPTTDSRPSVTATLVKIELRAQASPSRSGWSWTTSRARRRRSPPRD